MAEATAGRYDIDVVRALLSNSRPIRTKLPAAPSASLFTERKLECSTRAVATLKAAQLGLL